MNSHILKCNVWCSETDMEKAETLGIPEGDCWLPFAVDIRKIQAIKLCGPNEFLGNDKPTLYLDNGSHITIDVSFEEMVNIWENIKK